MRPRRPKSDGNNNIVIDALRELSYLIEVDDSRLRYTAMIRGVRIVALKIADMPGQIDWIILSDAGWFLPVEVKMPGKEHVLTDGERTWIDAIGALVASNSDTIKYAILENINADR